MKSFCILVPTKEHGWVRHSNQFRSEGEAHMYASKSLGFPFEIVHERYVGETLLILNRISRREIRHGFNPKLAPVGI